MHDQEATHPLGADAACEECGHVSGPAPWHPVAALRRRIGLRPKKVRLLRCGETQSYEDDELSSCRCRNPIHSA